MKKSHAAALSIAAAIVTLGFNLLAYLLTGSAGILSVALETLVNVAAAVMTFLAVKISSRPADLDHRYGYEKVEDLSAGIEGVLILGTVISIVYVSIRKVLHPAPLQHVDVGLLLAGVSAMINFLVTQAMLRVARREDSPALNADAHHLLSDVLTQVGVIAGVALAWFTGWNWLDPLTGLAVAASIALVGLKIVSASGEHLLDYALPPEEESSIVKILTRPRPNALNFHALRTRKAGKRRFVEFHLVVPEDMTVKEAHTLCNEIEDEIRDLWSGSVSVTIHVEPEGEEKENLTECDDETIW
jgi:cation diffusion facilitator family transporter